MKYELEATSHFKRQYKKLIKKHYDKEAFKKAATALSNDDTETLRQLKDHALTGNLAGYRELHIEADWLLVYERHDGTLTLVLTATGSHSDLYSK